VLGVNRSTYYKHFDQTPSTRELENQALRSDILVIYSKAKKRMGAYKIRQRLIIEYNKRVSVGKVYRLMKSMNLPKMSTVKPKTSFTKGGDAVLQNYLKKEFNPKAPNLVWVSDITYVKVSGRFCYVCAIMDLFSRKILSYKASTSIDAKLVLDTFRLAYSKRGRPKGVMFHSDRGTQYTSKEFRKELDRVGFVHSFSAKGHPYDNAVMESFFKYLKHEELNRRTFNTLQELNLSLFEYIEGFYNKNRPHSANDWLSPDEKEMGYFGY
jgi:putative transposase